MESPLELIALDGDHSGKVSGKLLFKVLKHRKLTDKMSGFILSFTEILLILESIVAHATDNTASNTTMNEALTKRIADEGSHLHRANMQIGCAAHVINLVVQYVTGHSHLLPD